MVCDVARRVVDNNYYSVDNDHCIGFLELSSNLLYIYHHTTHTYSVDVRQYHRTYSVDIKCCIIVDWFTKLVIGLSLHNLAVHR